MSGLPALYEISGQYQRLKDLEDMGELAPEVIRDTLEALEGDLQAKATNVGYFVKNLEAHAEMIDAAAKAMQQRAERVRRRAENVRNYLLFNMVAAGLTKVEAPEFSIAVRKNPEAVVVSEFAEVPAEFMVRPDPPPPRPDKKLLKEALKSGREIKGVWLEQGDRLEIKT